MILKTHYMLNFLVKWYEISFNPNMIAFLKYGTNSFAIRNDLTLLAGFLTMSMLIFHYGIWTKIFLHIWPEYWIENLSFHVK